MSGLRNKDGGMSTTGLLIITFIIFALITAGAYIGTRPAEEKKEEVPGEVRSLTITVVSPVTAGQSSSITVEAKDNEDTPVPDADISLIWDIPGARDEWGVPLALVDQDDGTYTSSLSSQWAGTYNLIASANTDVVATAQVSFEPGPSAGVVISSTSPKPASPYYVSTLTFYAVDAHGNIISGDDTFWSINSSFGQVGELRANPDDTFNVDILADNWGSAEVTITDEINGLTGEEIIKFMPTYLDLSYDFVEPTVEITAAENLEFSSSGDSQTLSLDIGIFFPLGLGTLGQYDLRVEYDSSALELVSVADPDPTDNFEAPGWWTSDNIIYLSQVGSATEPGVSVATIQFKPWEWVKEKAGKFITWVEDLWDDLMAPTDPPPGHVDVDGKVFQKLFIPIKAWIVEGSGVTEADVASDKERAEDVLNKNARACRLKYWYIFLNHYNYISENEWETKAGADGQLTTNEERDNLSRQNRWERWVNIYYVPDNALGGTLGLWDRSENAIFIDDNADFDNLTLVHELIHELSKSKVKDSPVDNASAQGGRDDNNIMNYDNTGENISENQGRLIDETTENNSEERPAGEGGGRIYKPTPYERAPTLGEVHSLTITADSPVTAGESSSITVEAKDAEGNPVSGANISLSYTIPGARESWDVALQLVDQEDGSYTSSLTSQWAGAYIVAASVEGTTIWVSSDVTVIPREVADVVIHSPSPRPALPWYTSMLTFYFVDQYGNIVPGEEVNPQVESTFGLVGETSPLQRYPDDTFIVSINAAEWGTAEVTIADGNTGVSASKQMEFTPAYVNLSYDLVEPTVEFASFENLEFVSSGDSQSLSLDIGIFFPPGLGTLGQYDMRVEYDSSILEVVGVTDPDPTDNFGAPELSTSDNIIYLSQVGSATEPGVSVATIQFRPGEWVENLWEDLKEKAGKIITWVEDLWDDLMEPVETPPGTVVVDGKVFKKLFIPLKIWIVDGSGVSDDAARSDAERAEDMLNKNAKACRLKYWYVFLVEINHISEGEWGTKAGADGQLTNDERDNLSKQNRWERWINVYYVPDNAIGGALGLWDRSENAIFIDDNADFDNRTLAHELIHELSKSAVKDSPVENASAQGGRDDNNIMNYDNTGDDISEEQGGLIEDEVDNRAEDRPAGEGGGSIYKPNPYRVEPTLGRVHVASIETGYEHFEGYSYAKAWVTVEDAEGDPVAGATVIAEVDRPDGIKETASGGTESDGVALLSHYTTFYGDYTFTVTDVQVEGMQYDPAANVVSSASVTLA